MSVPADPQLHARAARSAAERVRRDATGSPRPHGGWYSREGRRLGSHRERGSARRLRRLAFGAVSGAALLVGCGSAEPELAVPTPTPRIEVTEFLVFRGDTVIATERHVQYPNRIDGAIELPGRVRATYTASVDELEAVRRIDMALRDWETDALGDSISVDFVIDSVFAQHHEPLRYEVRRGGGPAVPYLHPSPGLLQQIVRYASRTGANPAPVRVWLMNNNYALTARVNFVAEGIVDIDFAGGRIRVWYADDRLVLAEIPSLDWVIMRRPGGP